MSCRPITCAKPSPCACARPASRSPWRHGVLPTATRLSPPWRKRATRCAASSRGSRLVAQLGPPPDHELLQLGADGVVQRRRLIAVQRRAPDLTGARGGVPAALLGPAIEVLGGGQQRAIEALAEALERMGGAEEVPSGAHLKMGVEGQRGLVDLQGRELVTEFAQQL